MATQAMVGVGVNPIGMEASDDLTDQMLAVLNDKGTLDAEAAAAYQRERVSGILAQAFNRGTHYSHARLREGLTEIERTCYIPTSPSMKAYTHFQRDFDKIRGICARLLSSNTAI